jgi:hypothetical protein
MAKTPAMSPSDMPPGELLEALPQSRKDDARALMDIMAELTAESPVVWAGRIVGYGQYRYRYDSGHKGVAPLISFAAGPSRLAIYLIGDFGDRHQQQLSSLGTFTRGNSCLYVKRLQDIDLAVLRNLIDRSVRVRRGIDKQFDN